MRAEEIEATVGELKEDEARRWRRCVVYLVEAVPPRGHGLGSGLRFYVGFSTQPLYRLGQHRGLWPDGAHALADARARRAHLVPLVWVELGDERRVRRKDQRRGLCLEALVHSLFRVGDDAHRPVAEAVLRHDCRDGAGRTHHPCFREAIRALPQEAQHPLQALLVCAFHPLFARARPRVVCWHRDVYNQLQRLRAEWNYHYTWSNAFAPPWDERKDWVVPEPPVYLVEPAAVPRRPRAAPVAAAAAGPASAAAAGRGGAAAAAAAASRRPGRAEAEDLGAYASDEADDELAELRRTGLDVRVV